MNTLTFRLIVFLSLILNFFINQSFAHILSPEERALQKTRENIIEEIYLDLKEKNLISKDKPGFLENKETILNFLDNHPQVIQLSTDLKEKLINNPNLQVKQIATGKFHSLVLTKNGEVFSFGKGSIGQLGHRDRTDQLFPKKIESLSDLEVTQIAAGGANSFVLTKSGEVFSFGDGYRGSLGHSDYKNQFLPKKIELLPDLEVIQIAAGGTHSLILTKDGQVLSFGGGESGKLGHGNEEDQLFPKKIESLSDLEVIQIAAGGVHSLVLTRDGKIYSFGDGYAGSLGHGNEENQLRPKKIEFLSDLEVIQIAAGNRHSLALTKDGQVFSFGDESLGLLIPEDPQLVPRKIEFLSDYKVIQIGAGGAHSLALTEDKEVFSFGLGALKIPGHRDKNKKLLFNKIELSPKIEVIQMSGGDQHSLILTKDREVFSFGMSEFGQLGHGNFKNQDLPIWIEEFNSLAKIWRNLNKLIHFIK